MSKMAENTLEYQETVCQNQQEDAISKKGGPAVAEPTINQGQEQAVLSAWV
jgi:hypothetical protein